MGVFCEPALWVELLTMTLPTLIQLGATRRLDHYNYGSLGSLSLSGVSVT